MNYIFFYMKIIKHLLHADMLNLKKEFLNKCIDLLIWVGCVVGIAAYLMTAEFGTTNNMGVFFLGSCLASAGLFEVYNRVFMLVNDFESEQTIYYYLNLPIPAWLYMMKNILYYAINSILMGLPIIPIGKVLLWNSLDLARICWGKLLIIYVLAAILYGTIALLLASYIKSLRSMEHLWMRCIFPMWFLGGYNNSWQTTYELSPYLGYAALLNPITYIMEGSRIALLGTEGPISFLWCVSATLLFISLSAVWSLKMLKKRLDFV